MAKIKLDVMPIADKALGIADKIMELVVNWSKDTERRNDKKSIKYAKDMIERIRELDIKDKKLDKTIARLIETLD